jgi:hypothetical protein
MEKLGTDPVDVPPRYLGNLLKKQQYLVKHGRIVEGGTLPETDKEGFTFLSEGSINEENKKNKIIIMSDITMCSGVDELKKCHRFISSARSIDNPTTQNGRGWSCVMFWEKALTHLIN